MKDWRSGRTGGVLVFLLIAGLVAGGLGWATAAALRLEAEQTGARAEAVEAIRLRLALGRLDGALAPILAREDARPFNHYSAVYPLPLALTSSGAPAPTGAFLEPSPLLNAELPPWMLLHFQVDASGWVSPQAPQEPVLGFLQRLKTQSAGTGLPNLTRERRLLLERLQRETPGCNILDAARSRVAPATLRDTTLLLARREADLNNAIANLAPFQGKGQQVNSAPEQVTNRGRLNNGLVDNEARAAQKTDRDLAYNYVRGNGGNWLNLSSSAGGKDAVPRTEVTVNLTPIAPLWLTPADGPERLLLVRLVTIETQEVCQGVVLDADALRKILLKQVSDEYPDARLEPAPAGRRCAPA
jgi:hypothetical protein